MASNPRPIEKKGGYTPQVNGPPPNQPPPKPADAAASAMPPRPPAGAERDV